MSKTQWDKAKEEQLIELYKLGKYTTKEIGEIMGFSKNSIVGKINRMQINKKTPSVNIANKADKQNKLKVGEYPLVDIGPGMCVWPMDNNSSEITFCGDKTFLGRQYCKDHLQQAYYVSKQKNR